MVVDMIVAAQPDQTSRVSAWGLCHVISRRLFLLRYNEPPDYLLVTAGLLLLVVGRRRRPAAPSKR